MAKVNRTLAVKVHSGATVETPVRALSGVWAITHSLMGHTVLSNSFTVTHVPTTRAAVQDLTLPKAKKALAVMAAVSQRFPRIMATSDYRAIKKARKRGGAFERAVRKAAAEVSRIRWESL